MKNILCCSCGRPFGKSWRADGLLRFKSLTPRGKAHYVCQNCRRKGFDPMRHMIDHIQGVAECHQGAQT